MATILDAWLYLLPVSVYLVYHLPLQKTAKKMPSVKCLAPLQKKNIWSHFQKILACMHCITYYNPHISTSIPHQRPNA